MTHLASVDDLRRELRRSTDFVRDLQISDPIRVDPPEDGSNWRVSVNVLRQPSITPVTAAWDVIEGVRAKMPLIDWPDHSAAP